jgi:hypothetical protein
MRREKGDGRVLWPECRGERSDKKVRNDFRPLVPHGFNLAVYMMNEMMTQSGLYYGNVPTGVQEVLVRLYERSPTFTTALIRCLDSDHTPSGVLGVLARYGIEGRLDASGAAVSKEELFRAAKKRGLFAGFDEVWLFEDDRPNRHIPSHIVLTSDGLDFNNGLPEGLEACMRDSRCVLALGDGCGLNYATWDCELQNWLAEDQ